MMAIKDVYSLNATICCRMDLKRFVQFCVSLYCIAWKKIVVLWHRSDVVAATLELQ